MLAERCVELFDVTAAGIMLATPDGTLRVIASSSEAMRVLELFELQSQEGPCVDCYATKQPVLNQNLDAPEEAWPRFSEKAREAGIHSVHALPMRLRDTVIGALNLFRLDRGEMSDADVDAAQALADAATIAILQHRAVLETRAVNQQLQQALTSRVIIEQAKGILAERGRRDGPCLFRASSLLTDPQRPPRGRRRIRHRRNPRHGRPAFRSPTCLVTQGCAGAAEARRSARQRICP